MLSVIAPCQKQFSAHGHLGLCMADPRTGLDQKHTRAPSIHHIKDDAMSCNVDVRNDVFYNSFAL